MAGERLLTNVMLAEHFLENSVGIESDSMLYKQSIGDIVTVERTLSDFQNRINQSVNDSDNGKLTSSENFLDEIAEWK
jgi:hypothetical protein